MSETSEPPLTIKLPAEAFDKLVELLDKPPAPNEALKKLMHSKSPWQKGDDDGR